MINGTSSRTTALAALALTAGLSGTVQAQEPGACPNAQTGTSASYPHIYSDCTVSSAAPVTYPVLGAVETNASISYADSGLDPAPGASLPVGELDSANSFVASMGPSYTGNCTEVAKGSNTASAPLTANTFYCAVVATTGGDNIYFRGFYSGFGWQNPQVLTDAISNTPASVPALPLFGLLSLGGLLGLFGARRLGRR
jgi:hypothetical protein